MLMSMYYVSLTHSFVRISASSESRFSVVGAEGAAVKGEEVRVLFGESMAPKISGAVIVTFAVGECACDIAMEGRRWVELIRAPNDC